MKRESGNSSQMVHGKIRGLARKLGRVKTWLDNNFNKNHKLNLAKRVENAKN